MTSRVRRTTYLAAVASGTRRENVVVALRADTVINVYYVAPGSIDPIGVPGDREVESEQLRGGINRKRYDERKGAITANLRTQDTEGTGHE